MGPLQPSSNRGNSFAQPLTFPPDVVERMAAYVEQYMQAQIVYLPPMQPDSDADFDVDIEAVSPPLEAATPESSIAQLPKPRKTKKRKPRMPKPCSVCGKTYTNFNHSKTHFAQAHSGIKDYACRVENCSEKFFGAQLRRRHEKNVHHYFSREL